MPLRAPRLVLFDCDGVLVDTEPVVFRAAVELCGETGITTTVDEVAPALHGGRLGASLQVLARRLGRALPDDFEARLRARMLERFRDGLRPVDGVPQVLDEIRAATCVVSNGPMEKMRVSLGVTGLLARFEGRIFSAYDVGVWKPDPGLFLHAARAMGAAPADCAVVEDGVEGVRAAVAAGMRALGLGATAARTADLVAEGAEPLPSMRALPAVLAG